jgi:hypothetical protein
MTTPSDPESHPICEARHYQRADQLVEVYTPYSSNALDMITNATKARYIGRTIVEAKDQAGRVLQRIPIQFRIPDATSVEDAFSKFHPLALQELERVRQQHMREALGSGIQMPG